MDLLDRSGRFRTKSLFFEQITVTARESGYEPVFTLKRKEHKGLPSLKELYMSYEDPTEYDFAMGVFNSWDHWKHLCSVVWFQPFISAWREEVEVRMRSAAIKAINETAINEGAKGTAAAKYIAEKGWEKRAGRPSKEEIKRQQRIHAGISSEINEDAERMGITH